ncbi:hypothetical protein HZS_7089 [Henneguya salminicola]|nr:hypothetical protein HZS_7089 [Henneguya salminicola]
MSSLQVDKFDLGLCTDDDEPQELTFEDAIKNKKVIETDSNKIKSRRKGHRKNKKSKEELPTESAAKSRTHESSDTIRIKWSESGEIISTNAPVLKTTKSAKKSRKFINELLHGKRLRRVKNPFK